MSWNTASLHSLVIIAAQECTYDIVQQNKSTFYEAILKMGAAQTKGYNIETGVQISNKYDTNVANNLLFVSNLWKFGQRAFELLFF